MKFAGVDYSMTSPAITTFDTLNNEYHYYFYTGNKKLFWEGNFHGTLHLPWSSPEQRFDQIGSWAIEILKGCDRAFIEGYAFGARGQVFNIGENTGVLKNKMWNEGIPLEIPGPTMVKKFATGKGNAKKPDMEAAFIDQTGIDVKKMIGQKEKDLNPSSDIIDSYFLCQMCIHDIK